MAGGNKSKSLQLHPFAAQGRVHHHHHHHHIQLKIEQGFVGD